MTTLPRFYVAVTTGSRGMATHAPRLKNCEAMVLDRAYAHRVVRSFTSESVNGGPRARIAPEEVRKQAQAAAERLNWEYA